MGVRGVPLWKKRIIAACGLPHAESESSVVERRKMRWLWASESILAVSPTVLYLLGSTWLYCTVYLGCFTYCIVLTSTPYPAVLKLERFIF